uniref:Aspartic peptidase DDI1-type domain-containing protein n=1 Tax=Attheya septentrionalis TaxID=420275 RepID=A0A7S2UML6_9STRA|mmetsp:Transcript_29464/g.53983  ORF Transcript_29464/g.53983 Transcript_29464/m.53983 type:complete len:409 (+) Transcript_29464:279-1505(+)|eukprot:CAMPEP_0198288742 /NCGR_PEP_ID=MMETSP1449-20131203/7157_1 /TAXON_ID=420275 /ORGANISM="Attheya septentrionalis, Strain CCMP2084" /LENGTH=408 /DNA_ID=CAMNT_0043986947 /DNA_START=197 /DNA_END=1423 /DNA_ORIENTATION=+
MTAWMFRHLACLTFLLLSQGTEGSTKPHAATRYSDGSSSTGSSHELVGRQGRPVVRRRRLDAEHDGSSLDDLNLELELEEQGDALLDHPEEEERDHRNRSLLRVPCRVTCEGHEDQYELETIVDTGAQVTVMTLEAVRKCRLLHLVDRRYAGHATGVGKVRVLGKLPAHTLHLLLGRRRPPQDHDDENQSDDHPPQHARLSTGSIVVIESTGTPHMDLLIGLDLLDEWHATIRLGTSSPSLTLLRPTNNNQQDKEEITIPFLASQSHRKTRVVPQQRQQEQQQRHTASSSMFASPQSHKKFRHGRYASSSSSSRQTFQTRPVATPSSSSPSSHIPRHVMDCDLESDLDMLDSSSSSGSTTVSSAPEFSTTVATMESWDHEDDDDDDDDTYLDHDEDDPYGDVFDLSGI